MSKGLGHYVSVAFLPWFALGAACSGNRGGGDEAAPPLPSAAPASDAAVSTSLPPRASLKQVAPAADEPTDAGAVADTGSADGGALDAGPEAAPPRCVPEGGADEPDEAFADTNCDGIDGDASKAFFVAPTGSDSDSGEMSSPFKTIGRAIVAAAHDGKDVYVCNGEYTEAVRIDKLSVSIYGGYDCANGWKRVLDRATLKPAQGVPLTITDTVDSVVIDRLTLRAPDAAATDFGASSIAASVVKSQSVTFRRSALIAGRATSGKDGDPPGRWVAPQRFAAAAGVSAVQQDCVMANGGHILQGGPDCFAVHSGGSGDPYYCQVGSVLGGKGGNGGNVVVSAAAETGGDGVPSFDPFEPGRAGKSGVAGKPGAPGAGFGVIDHGLYVPSNHGGIATRGENGEAGYGGSGGISVGRGDITTTFWVGGGGGQGGYPGCGGAEGEPGGGGGASIALVSDSSGVRLEHSSLVTGKGGDGGHGSEGIPGQKGGAGGPGGTGSGVDGTFDGQPGGSGGDGGDGGAGGPGGGGPSVGIAWTKSAPTTVVTTFTLGAPGLGMRTSARTAADGVLGEFYPPVKTDDAGAGGAQ